MNRNDIGCGFGGLMFGGRRDDRLLGTSINSTTEQVRARLASYCRARSSVSVPVATMNPPSQSPQAANTLPES